MKIQLDKQSSVYEDVFELAMFLERFAWNVPVIITINAPLKQIEYDDVQQTYAHVAQTFSQIRGLHLYKNRLTIDGEPSYRFEDIQTISYDTV